MVDFIFFILLISECVMKYAGLCDQSTTVTLCNIFCSIGISN